MTGQVVEQEILLSPRDVSDLLNVDTNTLYKWRAERKGPPFYKLGSGDRAPVRYRKSEVLRFLADARRDTTT